MRPVMLLTPEFDKSGKFIGANDRCEAKFHGWGVQYDEFESGPGNFTVAIVEMEDGSVGTCTPQCIRFLDSEEEKLRSMHRAFADPIVIG